MRFALLLLAGFLLLGCASTPAQDGPDAAPSANDSDGGGSGITASELAEHNSGSSCWIVYEGEVYDITDYLPDHKDEAEVLRPHCGMAAGFDEAFEGAHGTDKVGKLKQEGMLKGTYEG